MITATSNGASVLELWRGESRGRRREIATRGLHCKAPPLAPSWPTLGQLRFGGLPPPLLATLGAERLVRHVGTGSDGSDFISFTRSADIAATYAHGSTGRQPGLLVGVRFQIMEAFLWQTPMGTGRDAFVDDRGRVLLSVAGLIFPTHHEWTAARTANHVRRLGDRDAEFVMLGSVDPAEIVLRDV